MNNFKENYTNRHDAQSDKHIYDFFFAKSTCIYYESQLYKFIREQFIVKFPDREPRMKASISLIQKLEIWGRALNASYCCALFVLTQAF